MLAAGVARRQRTAKPRVGLAGVLQVQHTLGPATGELKLSGARLAVVT